MSDEKTCPECGFVAKSIQGLFMHRRQRHGIERQGIERSAIVERLDRIEVALKRIEELLSRKN